MALRSCRVLLVSPRFVAPSFWNYRATCEIGGARYPSAPLSLITVAALLPVTWDLRLLDRNVEDFCDDDIDAADLIMTGGMMAQKADILAIIRMCHARGKPVVVGGPDITSNPHLYEEADFQVRGEAESVIGSFIDAWTRGERQGVFEAEKFQADLTRSPTPRFDLLKFDRYLEVSVQFSRGCPFTCEFCDIIELYGRVPRTKTKRQMLAELETIYHLGYRGNVNFVDDNFIGNKKAVKQFLPDLAAWQKARGYPFEFITEASINLADDSQLLELMRDANFWNIFVGIESPDSDTLIAAQKKQNTRRNLATSVHKIYASGIVVCAGFILGFDSETRNAAVGMINCIEETAIPACMVGLLAAVTNTQLTRRLAREGRLHPDHDVLFEAEADQGICGLNFETLRPRRDVLVDFATVVDGVYAPDAYFRRVQTMGRGLNRIRRRKGQNRLFYAPKREFMAVLRLFWRMTVTWPHLRRQFWRTVLDCVMHNASALRYVLMMIALYAHFGPFSRYVVGHARKQIASIDQGEWKGPASRRQSALLRSPMPARLLSTR